MKRIFQATWLATKRTCLDLSRDYMEFYFPYVDVMGLISLVLGLASVITGNFMPPLFVFALLFMPLTTVCCIYIGSILAGLGQGMKTFVVESYYTIRAKKESSYEAEFVSEPEDVASHKLQTRVVGGVDEVPVPEHLVETSALQPKSP